MKKFRIININRTSDGHALYWTGASWTPVFDYGVGSEFCPTYKIYTEEDVAKVNPPSDGIWEMIVDRMYVGDGFYVEIFDRPDELGHMDVFHVVKEVLRYDPADRILKLKKALDRNGIHQYRIVCGQLV